MLSKKDIEELATGAVKSYFNTCNLISPQIQENDKTPDWDGFLNIYKTKKDIRGNYLGCLRVQVKGIKVNKFKVKESYPVETVFLNNARSEGFVFFVVEVKEEGASKIFYKMMAPIEIRKELSLLKDKQKTKNFSFEELDNDRSVVSVRLAGFLEDCQKQKSFADKDEFKIENIKDATEYQWGFTLQGKKENFANTILDGVQSFLYVKTKEGAEIPVGSGRMTISIPEIRNTYKESVRIDNTIVSEDYILVYSKDFITYQIPNVLSFKIKKDLTITENNVTIDILAKDTKQYIKAYTTVLLLLKVGHIKFGDHFYSLNASNGNNVVSGIEKKISDFKKHAEIIELLSIKTPIDYNEFSNEDNKSIRQLYKALIEHQPIGLNNPKYIFKLDVANISILLTCHCDGNNKYYIDDFFNTSSIQVTQMNDDISFQAPTFSFLKKNGFVLFDNIPYEKIVDSYKELAALDSRVFTLANLDLLEMIKAADELQQESKVNKRNITLETALKLAEWLIDSNEDPTLVDIHKINYIQITKRLRSLTDDERKSLLTMTQSGEDMIKAAANILLDNIDIAKYIIENMQDEDKKAFTNFPIYNLVVTPVNHILQNNVI